MTRAPLPPFVDAQAAYRDLEPGIARIQKLAKLQRLLGDTFHEDGTAEFKQEVAEGMALLSSEIFEAADTLEDLWTHFWNEGIADLPVKAVRS